jgi:hypothetical protein
MEEAKARSKNCAITHANLCFALSQRSQDYYTVLPSITLDTPPTDMVPDVAIYPLMEFDSLHDETKMEQMPLGIIEIILLRRGIRS